jgi:hypothetical protein
MKTAAFPLAEREKGKENRHPPFNVCSKDETSLQFTFF